MISEHEHKSWVENSKLQNISIRMLILCDSEPAGYVSLHLCVDSEYAEMSIHVDASFQGKGVGQEAANKVIQIGQWRWPALIEIIAVIHHANIASLKFFRSMGFTPQKGLSDGSDFGRYVYPLKANKAINIVDINRSDHRDQLYALFHAREHRISALNSISRGSHHDFVMNHPYRFWFIFYDEGSVAGSIYLSNNNSIGLNLREPLLDKFLKIIIGVIAPLPESPSVTPPYYYLNIPSSDASKLEWCKSKPFLDCIQKSFRLNL